MLTSSPRQPADRLWLAPAGPGPQTRLFRFAFELASVPTAGELNVYAESNGHVWLNGTYLGRGPIYHHPTVRPHDAYDPVPHLQTGRNVLAVLVHTPGMSLHNHVPAGEPGLVADLTLRDSHGKTIAVTGQWKATADTGWSTDVPRRTWAIGHLEDFDATRAPVGWQSVDFDDSAWPPAEVLPATTIDDVQWIGRPLPPLRYGFIAPARHLTLHRFDAPVEPITASAGGGNVAKRLLDPPWLPADGDLRVAGFDPATGAFTVHGLVPDRGAIICFDLGHQQTGQLIFDAHCDSPGTIDVGWSETYENGKPWLCRKGAGYCDRIHAPAGPVRWEPIGYSSMRYLMVVLRGFSGSVRFDRFGIRTSEPALDWSKSCDFGDDRLNAIWKLCADSFRLGIQEGVLDCPTREQAVYVGDGLLVARWVAQVTGDLRHWKYLLHEQFRRQSDNGLIRGSVFSGANDTLLDYPVLAVIGLRDYWRFTGDRDALRLVANARKTLAWFEQLRAGAGLCTTSDVKTRNTRSWEYPYDPAMPHFTDPDATHLFIDHPGMGWHNIGDAGIDRRGTNCALNALLVQARRALADLEEACGDTDRAAALRADADATAGLIREQFLDSSRLVFIDGTLDGQPLQQVSEQTNTWAVAARAVDDQTARAALESLLTSDDPAIARNGPYFWTYLYPELARLGLHALALDKTRALWGQMLDGGATALWETFAGDDLDSWCHPWAAAPVQFLLEHILGLPRVLDAGTTLRPRPDLLPRAKGQTWTANGWVAIAWETAADGAATVSGSLPEGHSATVINPRDQSQHKVEGNWRLTFRP